MSTTLKPTEYIAFDTETTGLDHTGQIIQIGLIRLNQELEEIERSEMYCMLNPSNIPAVGAFKTHQIPLSHIMKEGRFEPAFARDVNDAFLKNPNTCVLGYNSTKFDDNRTRELFYRNMVDPYQREYMNGNSRYDVLKLTRALRVFKPDAIKWPIKEDGKTSMKLEEVAPLNNIIQENAHDAISDVEATIGLMKLIKEKEPTFFDYSMKLRDKSFVSYITYNKPFMMVGDGPSRDSMYTGVLLPIASHPRNKNSTICINVADIEDGDVENTVDKILSIEPEELEKYIYTRDKDKKLPIMEVRANQLPFVFTPALLKDKGVQERTGIDYETTMRNVKELSQSSKLKDLNKHLFKGYDREMPFPDDVYGHIYKGFIGNADKRKLERLSIDDYESWESEAKGVADNRIPTLIERAMGNIDTDYLSQKGKDNFESFMTERYNDLSGKYGETLPKFWYEVKEVLDSKDDTKHVKDLIKELEEHVDFYAAKYAPNLLNKKSELIKDYAKSIKIEEPITDVDNNKKHVEPNKSKTKKKEKSIDFPSL